MPAPTTRRTASASQGERTLSLTGKLGPGIPRILARHLAATGALCGYPILRPESDEPNREAKKRAHDRRARGRVRLLFPGPRSIEDNARSTLAARSLFPASGDSSLR